MALDDGHNGLAGMESEPSAHECKVWAVGGGKGGTGKSFITSSLGCAIAATGKRVVMLDADLGGANLHSFLGIARPKRSLTDFFDRKVPLKELITPTAIPNVGLVTGNLHSLDSDNIKYSQKIKLFRHIRALDTDYMLVDLGSGSHPNTLDTFLLADRLIVVMVPEITAIENLYHFIKNALFRKLRIALKSAGGEDTVLDTWHRRDKLGFSDFKGLVEYLCRTNADIAPAIMEVVDGFEVQLVLNQVRSRQEIKIGDSVRSVFWKYMGIHSVYSGFVQRDEGVLGAINSRQPFMFRSAGSACAREIGHLFENIEGRRSLSGLVRV